MSSRTVRLTVHFAQGEPFTVEADADGARMRNLASNIEKAMSGNVIGFALEGALHLFPLHGIRSIEISPAPDAVIKHVVRDVRRSS